MDRLCLLGLLSAVLLACTTDGSTPAGTPAVADSASAATPTATPSTALAPVASSSSQQPMPRGRVDPGLVVDIYEAAEVSPGTTLLSFNLDLQHPSIIEVNARGEIVWEYPIPQAVASYTNPGFDAELLPNHNILFVLPRNGVYEVNRSGTIVWSYLTTKVSHDADRLPNGNTLFAFGANDTKNDPQVVEVDATGKVVWSWYARDQFDRPPYGNVSDDGWTHTNAVQRLPNGNTQISLRNFQVVVEVNPQGAVVRTIGQGILDDPHDPVRLANGNLLVATQNHLPANQGKPQRAIEIDSATGEVVWQFPMPFDTWPVRDANRLPNGNTLITGSTAIVEVTPQGRMVWRLRITRTFPPGQAGRKEATMVGFFKAERIN